MKVCNGSSLQVTYQKGSVGTLREEEIIGNPCFAAFVKDYPWVFVDEANQEMEAPRAKKVSAKLQKEIDAEIAAGNADIIVKIDAVTWKPCVQSLAISCVQSLAVVKVPRVYVWRGAFPRGVVR